MKILFVSEYFWPKGAGGGEISMELLAKNLVKSGHDVSILTSYFKGLSKFEIKDGIRIFRMARTGEDPSSLLGNLKRAYLFPKSVKKTVLKLHAKEKFDVIHCMNLTSVHVIDVKKALGTIYNTAFLAHMNSPLNVCPKGDLLINGEKECKKRFDFSTCFRCCMNSMTLGTRKNKFYSRYNPFLFYLIYRRFKSIHRKLKKFDKLIAISEYPKKRMEKYTDKKIDVLYNIVNIEKFLTQKAIDNAVPKILFIGQYTKIKGAKVLLDALKIVKKKNISFECNYFGSGNLKEELEADTKAHNLDVNINDKIPFSEVPEKYGEHDIVVFPSIVAEAFGRITIESMAAGKPVIGSRIGGIQYLIEDDVTGLLVEPGVPTQLADALIKLLKNKDLRNRLGENGKRTAKAKFSAEGIVEKAQQIYLNSHR